MKKNNIKLSFLAIALILLAIPCHIYGEPMFAPTKEEALQSKWIVVAQYVSYKEPSAGNIDYFQEPIAQYEIIRVLSGDNLGKSIDVLYAFQDGSACLAPEGWKFTEDKMPQTKSEWILFLEQEIDNKLFATYRGNYGRWKATEDNIREIEEALRNKKQTL